MLQNAARLRKSAPGPPNMPDPCVSCTAPATQHASLQILFKYVTKTLFELLRNHHVLLTLGNVHNPLRLPCETTSVRPKVVQK